MSFPRVVVRFAPLTFLAAVLLIFLAVLQPAAPARAAAQNAPQNTLTQICPAGGIQTRGADYQPGGIILTSFDRSNLWVYNIDSNRRYPLPDTAPCTANCHLSPDSRWLVYFNDATNAFNKMRLDGTGRVLMVEYASDISWWDPTTLLVWTPAHQAYLQADNDANSGANDLLNRQYLDVSDVVSVQPGGDWGLMVSPLDDGFTRALVNLSTRGMPGIAAESVSLGEDRMYFNASSWSPDGHWLAYVGAGPMDSNVGIAGGEIFGIHPGDSAPAQWTDLTSAYGAVRINGRAVGELSWSPDSTRLAFWVIELLGPDPEHNTGHAVIHILNIATGDIQVYCGYSTDEHTPNPSRLVWSPDGTQLAFGGNVPGDNQGYLLLALDTASGVFTQLSNGIYPAFGTPNVVAWGLPPQ